MDTAKDTRSKADLIRTFLDQYQPKLPEARGFLQFLLAKEEILRRLDIVADLTDEPHAILVSSKGSGGWPFFYRRGERYYHKTSQAVVELMKFIPEKIHLCLCTVPTTWSSDQQEFRELLAAWHDELFHDEIGRVTQRQSLLQRIDAALSAGDRGSFDQLTEQLRQLG